MADFRINVIVDPSRAGQGARRVKRELRGVENAADRVRRSLARAFAFVGIGAGISAIVQLADAFTNLQNRLRTVTDGTAQLEKVTSELFAISQATRASFTSTAELYARVGLATRELGVSQEQTLDFTKSLNQAIILSGASAQEAQAGLIQLSQGLASGTLRGDELRSVLEQLPVVADVIAKQMGVTRGELRELGADGKISAQTVIDAFASASDQLDKDFANSVITIGQAFTTLRNSIVLLFGELATNSGVAQAFAKAINDIGLAISVIAGADVRDLVPEEEVDRILRLAQALEFVGRAAVAAGIALSTQFVAKGLRTAIAGVRALTVAMLANPITALPTIILAVVSAMIAFGDQWKIASDGVATFHDLFKATFEAIGGAVASFINFFSENFGKIGEVVGGLVSNFDFSFRNILTLGAKWADAFIGLHIGAAKAVVAAFKSVPAALEAIFVAGFNAISQKFTGFINGIIKGINAVAEFAGLSGISELEAVQLEASTTFGEIGASVGDAFAEGFSQTTITDAVNGVFDRAEQIAQDRIADQKLIDLANQSTGVVAPDGTPTRSPTGTGGGSRKKAVDETNEALERQKALLEEITGAETELSLRAMDLQTLFQNGAISLEQFTAAMRDLNVEVTALDNSFSGGLANGFARIAQEANNIGSQMSDFVVGSFNAATDAIVQFAKTGQLDLRQFFQDLFANLLKLAANQLFSQLIGGLLGGGGALGGLGGGGGLLGSLLGFQNGGSFNVGGSGGTDSQLVAFRASPNENVEVTTPAQQRQKEAALAGANGGGGNSEPVINITNVTDPAAVVDTIGTDAGTRAILNVIERNPQAVQRVLNR